MAGDVFGNGMLLSKHIRLVAAFDHRHVFIDPDPVAATSFKERQRLFKLPRSSWADYDEKLISRSEEHTSELQSLMRISYAVFCLKKKTKKQKTNHNKIYNKHR